MPVQPGFFDFVALPLLNSWVATCPAAAPMLEAAKLNREGWAALDAAKAVKAAEEQAATKQAAAAAAAAAADASAERPSGSGAPWLAVDCRQTIGCQCGDDGTAQSVARSCADSSARPLSFAVVLE